MATGKRMFSGENKPHFFKIFFPEITAEKLSIPPEFIKQIDGGRSNDVASLKGPNGLTMTVDLVRDFNGMRFSNGWKSFIKDNCISTHDFLLIRYEGNMSFTVSVFDMTGLEKECDFTSPARRMSMDDREQLAFANGLTSTLDFSNEIQQQQREISVKQEEIELPLALPHTNHPQTPSQIVKDQSIMNSPKILRKTSRNKQWYSSNQTRGKFMIKVRKLGVVSNRREVTYDEVKNTYDKATFFTSKNPTMLIVMRECYVYRGFFMNIPVAFIREHLPAKTCDMKLWDPNKIEWTVKFVYHMGRGGFSANWGTFSQANNLELNDVCVFELIQPNEMRVHIFRVVEELTPLSQRRNNVDGSVFSPDFEGQSETTEGNKNNNIVLPRTPMSLKRPYFVITIKKYNITSTQPYWRIPTTFELLDYLMEKSSVTMVDSKGLSWKINLRQYRLSSNKSLRSTGGWVQFIRDNQLEVGDVCSFELVHKGVSPKFAFVVHKSRQDGGNTQPPPRSVVEMKNTRKRSSDGRKQQQVYKRKLKSKRNTHPLTTPPSTTPWNLESSGTGPPMSPTTTNRQTTKTSVAKNLNIFPGDAPLVARNPEIGELSRKTNVNNQLKKKKFHGTSYVSEGDTLPVARNLEIGESSRNANGNDCRKKKKLWGTSSEETMTTVARSTKRGESSGTANAEDQLAKTKVRGASSAKDLVLHRCHFTRYTKVMKDVQLSESVKKKLRETCFGHFLDAGDFVVDSYLLDEICSMYIGDSFFDLKGQMIQLTIQDVGIIIGLPFEGRKINLEQGDYKTHFWKDYFKGQKLDRCVVENKLEEEASKECPDEEAEDNICRLWLCLIFSTFLFPSPKLKLRKRLLIYIEDMKTLDRYNWAEAIHHLILNKMDVCKDRVKERENGGRPASVYADGCTAIIMIWLLEHTTLSERMNARAKYVYQKWCGSMKLWGKSIHKLKEDEVCLDPLSYKLGRKDEKTNEGSKR